MARSSSAARRAGSRGRQLDDARRRAIIDLTTKTRRRRAHKDVELNRRWWEGGEARSILGFIFHCAFITACDRRGGGVGVFDVDERAVCGGLAVVPSCLVLPLDGESPPARPHDCPLREIDALLMPSPPSPSCGAVATQLRLRGPACESRRAV